MGCPGPSRGSDSITRYDMRRAALAFAIAVTPSGCSADCYNAHGTVCTGGVHPVSCAELRCSAGEPGREVRITESVVHAGSPLRIHGAFVGPVSEIRLTLRDALGTVLKDRRAVTISLGGLSVGGQTVEGDVFRFPLAEATRSPDTVIELLVQPDVASGAFRFTMVLVDASRDCRVCPA